MNQDRSIRKISKHLKTLDIDYTEISNSFESELPNFSSFKLYNLQRILFTLVTLGSLGDVKPTMINMVRITIANPNSSDIKSLIHTVFKLHFNVNNKVFFFQLIDHLIINNMLTCDNLIRLWEIIKNENLVKLFQYCHDMPSPDNKDTIDKIFNKFFDLSDSVAQLSSAAQLLLDITQIPEIRQDLSGTLVQISDAIGSMNGEQDLTWFNNTMN